MRNTSIAVVLLVLAGCARDGELTDTGGVSVTRTACPAVAIPAQTGDITLFDPVTSRDARAIDIVATMTNVRSTCSDAGADVIGNATFEIVARRRDTTAAREVVLPYFSTVVQGGNTVVAKRLGRVAVRFAAGQARATTTGSGSAAINRAAATLPDDIQKKLTRRRKPDDPDASIDPLAVPEVRQAVLRASFELLVGFQLTPEQLQYNATR